MSGFAESPSRARFNFARDVLEAQARETPQQVALTYVDPYGVIERRTFADMARRSAAWANLFLELGFEPGERILVAVAPSADWPPIVMGALKAGVLPAPCSDLLGPEELADLVVEADATIVIASHAAERAAEEMKELFARAPDVFLVEQLRAAASQQSHEAMTVDAYASYLALVLFSGGEGEPPRAMAHTHDYMLAHRDIAQQWLGLEPGTRVWVAASTGSSTALSVGLLAPWSCGAEIVIHDAEFDPVERLTLVDRLEIDVLCQSSEEYVQIAAVEGLEQFDVSHLQGAFSYGPPLPPYVHERLRQALGITVREAYVTPETSVILANTLDATRPGSMGRPLGGADVAIVDVQGNELPPGIEGLLAVGTAHPTLFAGFATEAHPAPLTRGGRYVTGQRAVSDNDGYVWLSRDEAYVLPAVADSSGH